MIDIDVTTPEELIHALRKAADQYYESTSELQSTWQDPNIKVWSKLGAILERLADNVEKAVSTMGSRSRPETETLDLDVAAPDDVGTVLREASLAFDDRSPLWSVVSKLFAKAANRADDTVRKYV